MPIFKSRIFLKVFLFVFYLLSCSGNQKLKIKIKKQDLRLIKRYFMQVKAKNYLVKWNNFLVVVVLYEKKPNFCLGSNFFDVF